MNYVVPTKSPSNRAHWAAVAVLAMAALCPQQALAQMPARFYWKTLSDGNAVPLIVNSISGNTNPFDSAHTVTPGAHFEATMALPGYVRTFSLFDRAAMAAILLPMGRISGDVTVAGRTFNQSADGFGDPMLELDVNILGPPAQLGIPDVLRYEPDEADLLAALRVYGFVADREQVLPRQRFLVLLDALVVDLGGPAQK